MLMQVGHHIRVQVVNEDADGEEWFAVDEADAFVVEGDLVRGENAGGYAEDEEEKDSSH
jgi:hypothetical protein